VGIAQAAEHRAHGERRALAALFGRGLHDRNATCGRRSHRSERTPSSSAAIQASLRNIRRSRERLGPFDLVMLECGRHLRGGTCTRARERAQGVALLVAALPAPALAVKMDACLGTSQRRPLLESGPRAGVRLVMPRLGDRSSRRTRKASSRGGASSSRRRHCGGGSPNTLQRLPLPKAMRGRSTSDARKSNHRHRTDWQRAVFSYPVAWHVEHSCQSVVPLPEIEALAALSVGAPHATSRYSQHLAANARIVLHVE